MTRFATRPIVMGMRGVVTAGHYLAAEAGLRIMHQGGNAIDASAAMCFCINFLEANSNGIGGEVPTLIYSSKDKKTYAISGMGWSPSSLTFEWCQKNNVDMIPGDGYIPACVPAVVDTWALALARFGTMSFSQVLQPAIELADDGFPLYPGLHRSLLASVSKFENQYPTTAAIYTPGGKVPEIGSVLRNPDYAKTLRIMCRAENGAKGRGRIAGIEAARDAFYTGEIAEKIIDFISDNPVEDENGQTHKGLLSYKDISEWNATIEEPTSYEYKGMEIHKSPPWTQGPTFVQQLALLDGLDVSGLGHNSAEYLHLWIETTKLAFADREAYYGDPDFDDVPLDVLLSKGYNDQRREQISGEASMEMIPGDVGYGVPDYVKRRVIDDNRLALGLSAPVEMPETGVHDHGGDTTHLDAVDFEGNMVAATPSGGWIGTSPVISGLGFPIGTRGQMFYLNPDRPNALEPRKRPRATLTPTVVTKNNKPYMVFGTPGGDRQEQWTIQFFLNHVEFGMDLQEALEAPTLYSQHFPSSFYPRAAYPGLVMADPLIPSETLEMLRKRGHEIELLEAWSGGKVLTISYDADRGVISGAASPKGEIGYALSW